MKYIQIMLENMFYNQIKALVHILSQRAYITVLLNKQLVRHKYFVLVGLGYV